MAVAGRLLSVLANGGSGTPQPPGHQVHVAACILSEDRVGFEAATEWLEAVPIHEVSGRHFDVLRASHGARAIAKVLTDAFGALYATSVS